MTFEQFSTGDSLLHRTDPRVKIIAALFLSVLIAVCQSLPAASLGLVLALFLLAIAKISAKMIWKRLLLINSFNFLLWILLPLTYAQEPMVEIASIAISLPGMRMATLITVKSNGILLLFISLLATSTIASIGHALQEMRVSRRLCILLLFSYRYIFVIHQEYARLNRAASLRCFTPGTNLRTYQTYGYLLGMLLVKSWNRASRIQQAMELRGFSGTFYSLHELRMKRNDYIVLTGLLICGFILLGFILFLPHFSG
jgi:cobalt/nickel transport system permease protein